MASNGGQLAPPVMGATAFLIADFLQVRYVEVVAAAGIIIGVFNFTGLGFSLSLMLSDLGEAYGLFATLVVTAFLSMILGMGMPTAAVYVVLSIVLAPALVDMNVPPMAAHLFIFYFGLVSMLTPPVAVASYVAASLAGADMWRTSVVAIRWQPPLISCRFFGCSIQPCYSMARGRALCSSRALRWLRAGC